MLVPLLALAPLVQSEVVTLDTVPPTPVPFARCKAVDAHPAGGVIGTFNLRTSSSLSVDIETRRYSAQGDLIWAARMNVGPLVVLGQAISDLGGVALGIAGTPQPGNGGPRVVHYGSDGTLLWDVTLDSAFPLTELFLIEDVGFTAAGDVVVAAFDGAPLSPLRTVTALALDGATGAELWRQEIVSPVPGNTRVVGGEVYFTTWGTAVSPTVGRIDSAGQQVYSVTSPFPGAVAIADVDPFGNVLIRAHQAAALLDGTGSPVWVNPQLSTAGSMGTLLSSGEVIFASSNPSPALEWLRVDGTSAWSRPADPVVRSYDGQPIPLATGEVALYGRRLGNPTTGPLLEIVDPTGDTADLQIFPSIPAWFALAEAAAKDTRGNVWIGGSFSMPGAPTQQAFVSKVVPGSEWGSVACSGWALNSSGQFSSLHTIGSRIATDNRLTLVANDLPPNVPVLFLNSDTSASIVNPGGSLGRLCLGGAIGRHIGPGEIRFASPAGSTSLELDLTAIPRGPAAQAVTTGQRLFFQAWHRDTVGGVATSNLTGAVELTFQ